VDAASKTNNADSKPIIKFVVTSNEKVVLYTLSALCVHSSVGLVAVIVISQTLWLK